MVRGSEGYRDVSHCPTTVASQPTACPWTAASSFSVTNNVQEENVQVFKDTSHMRKKNPIHIDFTHESTYAWLVSSTHTHRESATKSGIGALNIVRNP